MLYVLYPTYEEGEKGRAWHKNDLQREPDLQRDGSRNMQEASTEGMYRATLHWMDTARKSHGKLEKS